MAMTATSRGANATNTAGQTTLAVVPTSNLKAGNTAILCIAYDNSGTLGADPFSGVTDTKGNLWSFDINGLNDPGAANAGIAVRILSTLMDVGALTTGDTITVSFGGITTVARAWALYEVAADDGWYVIEQNEGFAAQTSATPSITTGSIVSGEVVVACVGRAANGTRTADGDTTSGTWANPQNAGVGVAAAGAEIICETKIVSATATQTYNPTFGGASADGVNIWSRKGQLVRPMVTPPNRVYPQLLPQ